MQGDFFFSAGCPYFKQGVKNKAFQVHKSFAVSQASIFVYNVVYSGQSCHNMGGKHFISQKVFMAGFKHAHHARSTQANADVSRNQPQ